MTFRNVVLNNHLWSYLTDRYDVDILTPLSVESQRDLRAREVFSYPQQGVLPQLTRRLLQVELYLRYLPFYTTLALDAELKIIRYRWLRSNTARRLFVLLGRLGATRVGRWIGALLSRVPVPDRRLVARILNGGYALVLCSHTHELVSIIVSRAAREAGVPVACIVLGVDNLINHGPMLMHPDLLLAWGRRQVEEFTEYQCRFEPRLKGVRVEVVGNLAYDMYTQMRMTPREDFVRSLGLEADRRIILLTVTVEWFMPEQPRLAETIVRAIVESDPRAVLLIRPRPGFDQEVWRAFGRRFPEHVRVQTPVGRSYYTGPSESVVKIEEELAAMQQFADTLHHAEVVVTSTPSTIWLDALLFGRPSITVVYNPVLDRTPTPLRLWLDCQLSRPFLADYVLADSSERLAMLVRDHLSGRRPVRTGSTALLAQMAGVGGPPAGERAARALDRLMRQTQGERIEEPVSSPVP